jgi:hypothetical protein
MFMVTITARKYIFSRSGNMLTKHPDRVRNCSRQGIVSARPVTNARQHHALSETCVVLGVLEWIL